FLITHLTDQDHVAILTSRHSQSVRKRVHVGADLALAEDRFLGLVDELDGLLDREDVARAGLVDQVDDRRHRGGFTGAGRAGHQHQSRAYQAEGLQHRWQVQLIEGLDLGWYGAEHGPHAVRLFKVVRSEARDGPK